MSLEKRGTSTEPNRGAKGIDKHQPTAAAEEEYDDSDWYVNEIEFRDEIFYSDIRQDFVSFESSNRNPREEKPRPILYPKPFRLDSRLDGTFQFSVLKSATVFQDILRLLPPESMDVTLEENHLVIHGPFPLLRIRSEVNEMQSSSTRHREELRVLRRLYQEPYLSQALHSFEELTGLNIVDWEHLKGLFSPGSLVIFPELRDQWAVARVSNCGQETPSDNFYIRCMRIDFDGKDFRYVVERKEIEKFGGERSITELPMFPLQLHPDANNLISKLTLSGQRWKMLHDKLRDKKRKRPVAQVMEYDGYCERFEGDDPVGSQVDTPKLNRFCQDFD